MKYAFIVVSLGYWGRGKTLYDAAKQCKEAGARSTDECYAQIIIGDDKPAITGGGMLEREQGSEVINLGCRFKLGNILKLWEMF